MHPKPNLKFMRLIPAAMALTLMVSLAGCTMDAPTFLSEKRAEVVEDIRTVEMKTEQIGDETLDQIANQYLNYGDGPVEVVVTYNPASRKNTAMTATDSAARIGRALRHNNINQVETKILPVHDTVSSVTLIRYHSYTAQPPAGCTTMQEIPDESVENFRDYSLGCATETHIARQIARPKDLLGKGETPEETGARKRANVIEVFKSRIQNGDLQAERPSN